MSAARVTLPPPLPTVGVASKVTMTVSIISFRSS